MIKFNLLKKVEHTQIAILCFNMVDFNGFIYTNSHKLRQIYGNNIDFFLVKKYSDIINKKFITYRTTPFFRHNSYYDTIIREIQNHII